VPWIITTLHIQQNAVGTIAFAIRKCIKYCVSKRKDDTSLLK
jgi:hypothetical protein